MIFCQEYPSFHSEDHSMLRADYHTIFYQIQEAKKGMNVCAIGNQNHKHPQTPTDPSTKTYQTLEQH